MIFFCIYFSKYHLAPNMKINIRNFFFKQNKKIECQTMKICLFDLISGGGVELQKIVDGSINIAAFGI